jgi:hypothetical protein
LSAVASCLETNEEVQTLNKEREDIKNQMETSELKNTVTEIKEIHLFWLNSRMEGTGYKSAKLKIGQ